MVDTTILETSLNLKFASISAQKDYVDYTYEQTNFRPFNPKKVNSSAYFYPERKAGSLKNHSVSRRKPQKEIMISLRGFKFMMFLTVIMICSFLAIGYMFGSEASGFDEPSYKTVEVMQGDTLWSLASKYAPEGMDLRTYIHKISLINGVDANTLYAGMDLELPIYS